jgi:8-amino-7-oxononanoate synthase
MDLEETLNYILRRREEKGRLRAMSLNDGLVDFSSNDYLSLSKNASLRKVFLKEFKYCGKMGSGGSRLLDGNHSYIERLEVEISRFHNAPAGLIFNSGFDANVSVFTCVPQPNDWIIYDELIHASVHDGMKLSRAKNQLPFKHNSIKSLRECLEKASRDSSKNIFIAVESVYSMDGDTAPLSEIVQLTKSFNDLKTYIIVDEAHATGIIGPNGRGLVSKLGIENDIFIRVHTFGKALRSNGSVVLCSQITRKYLINYARPFIYSTSMAYPALASIRASYKFLQTNEFSRVRARLWRKISYFDKLYASAEPSKSPIIGVVCSNPGQLAALCKTHGIIARPIVYPTVPKGKERIRICIHANNTKEQIAKLVNILHSNISQPAKL